jgi:hypothetical protein
MDDLAGLSTFDGDTLVDQLELRFSQQKCYVSAVMRAVKGCVGNDFE